MYSGVVLFILGLAIGSFISAFTYRYPKRIQFLSGRSFCPNCKKQISWFDNIPVLSYIFLAGKCRRCDKKISLRYPLIEVACGIGFLLIGWNPVWLTLSSLLLMIFIIDFEHQIIPDELVFIGLAVTLLMANSQWLMANLLSGFLCASILLFIHLITRGRGMGLGDVKFAVLGGVIVGLKLSLIWLFLAFLTGGIVAIILVLGGNKKLKDKIAFGPFLIAAIPASHWLSSSLLSLLFPF